MKRRLFKTMVAVLAIAAAAAGPVRGQNANVSWVLTPYGDLQDGDTVVIVDQTSERALPNNYGTSSAPSAVEIELSGDLNAVTEEPAATLKWVVVIDNGNYQFRKPGTDDEYLYNATPNNSVRVGTFTDNQFTFEPGGPNDAPFLKNTYNSKYIGVYNNQDWRCYASTSMNIGNTVIGFYKRTVSSGGGSTPEPPAPAVPHTVRMAEGTVEAANWSLASGDASVTGTQVLENVMSGSELTATYNGTQKVKSVKAVKYVAPAATVTTAPTATAAIIEVGSTAALVNAGVANGGTMMYAVTTTNAQPASTADFSATRPTAEGRTAGTYYVWYYAKADANHSDSEIAGPVSVTLEVAAFILGGEGIFTNSRLQFTFRANNEDNNVWADWNGTSFTCGHGSEDFYGDEGARVSVNGAIISLGVSDDWDDTAFEGFTVNFNTSNNTYTITKGSYGQLPNDVTSVKVNGVEVKGNLTKQ